MLLLPDFRVRQRDYLLEISRAMTVRLDLEEVLHLILEAAATMLSGHIGLIALRDEIAGDFEVAAAYGVDAEQVPHFAPLMEAIQIDEEGQLSLTGIDKRMRLVARASNVQLGQVVALPMVVGNEHVGVIFIFRSYGTHFSDNDYMVLQSFADQAAIAVQNATLYEKAVYEGRRLAGILDHSADGIMILDADCQIERFNQALARITGWRPWRAIGEKHNTVIKWERREPGVDLNEALERGWPTEDCGEIPKDQLYVEGDLWRPDGTSISVGITYAPLIGEDGKLINIIVNVRDITHFRKAQEMTSTFTSIISHELKTPVALIKGYASTMLREDAQWDEETVRESFAVIEDEADRLTGLINNLLETTRLQALSSFKLEWDPVDLAQLAERSAADFSTQTDRHTITVDFPDDFPLIMGDATRLRQVIDNLLSNAIKYSPNGGEIRLNGTFTKSSVRVKITDEGIGIPQDEQQRIFERFYRVDDALTRRTTGTGLGLYLTKAIIEAHHGEIEVESTPGQGTTFTFQLPRYRKEKQENDFTWQEI